MTVEEAFAKNLRNLMDMHEVTSYELADWSGVSEPTICGLRTGQRNPSLHTAYSIAKAFRVTINDMIEGADE